jgi:predicted nuclease of restriction endonuclease-like RecB superfamily
MGEVRQAILMNEMGVDYEYEPEKWEYQHNPQTYTPDFKIKGNGRKVFYVEYKGKLTSDVRKKMRAIKACNPDKDLRIVFERANNKLSRVSKTTYGQWASSNGFEWAEGEIPEEWMRN